MIKPLISLCIPTNGVIEWVFPVLDSIFNQGVSESLFEVVVTDNGTNELFFQKMTAYQKEHNNIIYEKTSALPFLNEIEAYKRANGEFIKFVNHRSTLTPGALDVFIRFVEENREEKPIVYFSIGQLNCKQEVLCFESFDDFVRNLSYWSSCSTGMGFWKSDFEAIPENTVFNELFPHTTVLFRERSRGKYVIDNRVLLQEIPQDITKKGRYDLFHAFAVEYPGILCDLLRDGSISTESFLRIKNDTLMFISELYYLHVLRKVPCSYDLSNFDSSIDVYYSKALVDKQVNKLLLKAVKNKLLRFAK